MTGFRLGWIVAPPALMPDLGKLIEYNTSCSPVFVQRAGVAPSSDGEAWVARTRARLEAARDLLVAELARLPGIEVAPPPGAMYVFFRVAGLTDSLAYCKAARARGAARSRTRQRVRSGRRGLHPLVLRRGHGADRRWRRALRPLPRGTRR